MTFQVVWLPKAENELAAIWMKSQRRGDITRSVAELDRRLSLLGDQEGESRSNNNRITFESPIAIVFRVDLNSHTVEVGRVWEFS